MPTVKLEMHVLSNAPEKCFLRIQSSNCWSQLSS
jgi:hypothetical protein